MIVDPKKFATPEDIAWLVEQLGRSRISQRKVAEATYIDPSSLSRSLAGTRRMSIEEFSSVLSFVETAGPGYDTPLQRAYRDARISIADLAEKTRLSMPRITNLLRGRGDQATQEELAKLSRVLKVDFVRTPEPVVATARTARAGTDEFGDELPIYIPVLGAPSPLGRGFYRMSETVVENRFRPHQLNGVPRAFALFWGDEELAPRWLPGEVLYLHPGRPVVIGRWMMCDMKDRRIAIGRVASRSRGTVVLERPGHSDEVSVAEEEIGSWAAVVGSWSE